MTRTLRHSPAPWTLKAPEEGTNFDSFPWIASGNGQPIAEVPDNGPTGKGNAQLIAVAPELLEALRPLAGGIGITRMDVLTARAAIDKATKGVT